MWKKQVATIIAALALVGSVLGYVRSQELKLNEVATKQEGVENDISEMKRDISKILDILLRK